MLASMVAHVFTPLGVGQLVTPELGVVNCDAGGAPLSGSALASAEGGRVPQCKAVQCRDLLR